MTAPLRVAVVGAGLHGTRYAGHLQRGDVPGATLAGVCRRSPDAATAWRDRGVRFETDWRVLVDDPAVDALVVATPPGAHRGPAVAALERGKPLVLEKPVAATREDLAAIAAAAEAAGDVPVLVGHALRYNPVCRAWRDAVREFERPGLLLLTQRHERRAHEWSLPADEGGALMTCGVHLVDLVRWATGREFEEVVTTRLTTPGSASMDAEAWVTALLDDGTTVDLEASIHADERHGVVIVGGEDGKNAAGDYLQHDFLRWHGEDEVPVDLPDPVHGLVPLMADLVGAVAGRGSGDAATLGDGVRAVEVVLDIRERYSPR